MITSCSPVGKPPGGSVDAFGHRRESGGSDSSAPRKRQLERTPIGPRSRCVLFLEPPSIANRHPRTRAWAQALDGAPRNLHSFADAAATRPCGSHSPGNVRATPDRRGSAAPRRASHASTDKEPDSPIVVRRRGERQHAIDRLDPVRVRPDGASHVPPGARRSAGSPQNSRSSTRSIQSAVEMRVPLGAPLPCEPSAPGPLASICLFFPWTPSSQGKEPQETRGRFTTERKPSQPVPRGHDELRGHRSADHPATLRVEHTSAPLART